MEEEEPCAVTSPLSPTRGCCCPPPRACGSCDAAVWSLDTGLWSFSTRGVVLGRGAEALVTWCGGLIARNRGPLTRGLWFLGTRAVMLQHGAVVFVTRRCGLWTRGCGPLARGVRSFDTRGEVCRKSLKAWGRGGLSLKRRMEPRPSAARWTNHSVQTMSQMDAMPREQ
jgi:hypothetical protein